MLHKETKILNTNNEKITVLHVSLFFKARFVTLNYTDYNSYVFPTSILKKIKRQQGIMYHTIPLIFIIARQLAYFKATSD